MKPLYREAEPFPERRIEKNLPQRYEIGAPRTPFQDPSTLPFPPYVPPPGVPLIPAPQPQRNRVLENSLC